MTPYRHHAHDLTAPVRSIRVALALLERFGELLRKKKYSSDDELGLALGEARQLYPEIWSNLDDARAALARLGIEVANYDTVRSAEPHGSSGVTEVTVHEHPHLLRFSGAGGVMKTAYLNVAGYEAASKGASALRAALPTIDWEGLDRADALALEAVGSLGPPRWKKLLFGALAIAAAVLLVVLYVVLRIIPPGR